MAEQPQQNDATRAFQKVVAKAWADPAFKARLTADPKSVLTEHGVSIPESMDVRVVENSDSVVHFTLPAKPSGDLSDEQLDQAAGGSATNGIFVCMCA